MRIALALHEHTMLYEAAIAGEIFGVDRSDLSIDGSWYDFVVCTPDGTPSPLFPTATTRSYRALAFADRVIVGSTDDPGAGPAQELITRLRAAAAKGTTIASLCTGAFILAAAGLLDGRTATTHWMHADDLARRYPMITVRADVLYTDDGQVLTSAGKTAALDLCLHLVRTDFGSAVANDLARRLVAPSHRPGGQAQFIAAPVPPHGSDQLGAALEWARHHLGSPITVDDLAARAGLSTRQLARRMHAEQRTGPRAWLQRQRVSRAQELLERTDASIEQIASRCGLGSATTLRRQFRATAGTSPTEYRRAFRS